MILRADVAFNCFVSVIYVCGDDRMMEKLMLWGISVFSTYVEMILISRKNVKMSCGVLHVCGEDPVIRTRVVDSI